MALAWKAGAAVVAITPEEPMWLAGWAARRKPSEGKAAELFAKALALEDSRGERALIVTADLIAIPRDVAAAVSSRIQTRWGLPRARILFNASHTHTGPEVRPEKCFFFEIPDEFAARIKPYAAELERKLAEVCNSALELLEPARLTLHQARAGFVSNRRSAQDPADPEVPVLSVNSAEGRQLAIAFGCACHNLVLPHSFCQFHGDYAGVAQKELERAFPRATALFLSGAGGDQDPAPRGALDLAEQHGRALADAVRQACSRPGIEITGNLGACLGEARLDFLPLPSREQLEEQARSTDAPLRRKAEYLLAAIKENSKLPESYSCPVQVFRLGETALLIALGGEPVAEYALRLKSEFAGPRVWVAGYSNDMFGYLPTRRVQREGGYEAGRAALWSPLPGGFTETVEERVLDQVRNAVRAANASSNLI